MFKHISPVSSASLNRQLKHLVELVFKMVTHAQFVINLEPLHPSLIRTGNILCKETSHELKTIPLTYPSFSLVSLVP